MFTSLVFGACLGWEGEAPAGPCAASGPGLSTSFALPARVFPRCFIDALRLPMVGRGSAALVGLGMVITLLAAAPASACAGADDKDDVRSVVVTGEGVTKDEARRDALRRALEQGGKSFINSYSTVENFELVRDSIYARAEGIVTDYKILDAGDAAGGALYCKIRAVISRRAIASTWGEVQNLLDQIGRPVIVVFIQERIDGVLQDGSILEHEIEHALHGSGFTVYAGEQVRAIAEKESADARAEGNVAKVRAIAKGFGAQVFITGTAQANAAGVKVLYGEPTAMYNCDAAVKMYYTDTAELIASESVPNQRGGARGHRERSPQAGKQALANAAGPLVKKTHDSAMRWWTTRITAGGQIVLEIEGLTVGASVRIKRKLAELPNVERVNYAFSKGIATYRIVARTTAEDLVDHLVTGDWSRVFEIVGVSTNRIQAKAVGG